MGSNAQQATGGRSGFDAALYYPFLNFRNQHWLKRAVLHWDAIWRIAPAEDAAVDPPAYWASQCDDMSRLEDAGVVRSLRPNPMAHLEPLAALWRQFVAQHGAELAAPYRVNLALRDEIPESELEGRGYTADPVRRKRGIGWLLAGKMDLQLFHEMEGLGLAQSLPGHGQWYAFDERLLGAYMTSLANAVIGDGSLETVTDDPKHFRLFTTNTPEALAATLLPGSRAAHAAPTVTSAEDGMLVMEMAIESVCPAGLETFSMEELLQLRADSSGQRAEFKSAISGMVAELRAMRQAAPTGATALHPKQLEALRMRHIDKPVEELRKRMKAARGDAVISVVSLKSALEGGALGAVALGTLGATAPVIGAAGVALGLVSVVRSYLKSKGEVTKSPYSWLLEVEGQANAHSAVKSRQEHPMRLG